MAPSKAIKAILSVVLMVMMVPAMAWGAQNGDDDTASQISGKREGEIPPDKLTTISQDQETGGCLSSEGVSGDSEEMLDVAPGGDDNGTTIGMVSASQDNLISTYSNEWDDPDLADGLYVIASNLDDSLVLDVASSSPMNGAQGCLWYRNRQSNQMFSFQQQNDGSYIIRAYHSDKVLAVAGVKAANGAAVLQWNDNGTANMRWRVERNRETGLYRIVSVDTGMCLDFASDAATAGSPFVAWEITGSQKQSFSLLPAEREKSSGKTLEEGIYAINLSASSSLRLGSEATSPSVNGTVAQTQGLQDAFVQKFMFTYNDTDGCYTIANVASGKVLSVAGLNASSGTSVVFWDDNQTANMRWIVERTSNGFMLVSKDTNFCLDFAADDAVPLVNCVVWERTGSTKQLYNLNEIPLIEDGYYAISPSSAPGLRVDVNGGSTLSGTNAILWTVNGGMSQKFCFLRNSDGTYMIRTLHSGQSLGISSEGKIVQQELSSHSSQRWKLSPDGSGGIRFESYADDGSLRSFSTGGNVFSSASVWGDWSVPGNDEQSFTLSSVNIIDDGLYTISTAQDTTTIMSQKNSSDTNGVTQVLAQDGGLPWAKYRIVNCGKNTVSILTENSKALAVDASASNGASIIQWDNNNTDNMKWEVVPDYFGSVFLKNVQTGRNIDFNSDSPQVGADVISWDAHWGDKQKWRFVSTQLPREATARYGITLSEMLAYQMTNPYISSTWQEVLSFLDPTQLVGKDGGYYAFANLKGYTGLTATQLDNYIISTESGRSGSLRGTGAYFVEAAKRYNLNEMYLLAHAILESGWGTSDLASGYYYNGLGLINGNAYPAGTYYNFYGIGAYDDSPLSGGRSMAIQQGWDTPQKAIEGAASWIYFNYINRVDYPQVTLYDMRWDPARSSATFERSWHQYATSLTWASSIGNVMMKGYANAGVVPKLTFIIPRYS